jgi:hypothetical protein
MSISGSSDEDRSTDRECLARGTLFPVPRKIWTGDGTGHPCTVDNTIISSNEIENEILGPTTVWAQSMRALTRAIPLVGWLLFAGIVHAAPIIDQQHIPSGNFPAFAVANDRTQIQTFTVGITGALTAIDVQVSREPLTVENLVLSLWSIDAAGLPKARLATESVAPTDPAFTSTGPRPLIHLALTTGAVEVTVGELLAIELNSDAANNPPFNERYLWEIGGPYDRGTAYTQIGSSFFKQSEDFHFRTFVISVPEPGTLALLSTGLGGLLAYGWRRRRAV